MNSPEEPSTVVLEPSNEEPQSQDNEQETKEESPSQDDEPSIERTDTGAHLVTVSNPDSSAYKLASAYGDPVKTQDGKYRFALTDTEFQRFKKQLGA